MPILLKAADIIAKYSPELIKESNFLASGGLTPYLEVVLVGNNPASESYVAHKEKFCHKIGAKFKLTRLKEDVGEKGFIDCIKGMNENPEVTGCFVQLPVPNQLRHLNITQLINPTKDVDGFHLKTVTDIYQGNLTGILPCTPKGIITLLRENSINPAGKDIVIIGRSYIVGKPLALILEAMNGTVTICHSKTKDLAKHTKNADIIISAAGMPNLITKQHLRSQPDQVLIDVGMNKVNGKLVGDISFEDVHDHVKAITPVPGGVGPMTVYSLMQNLLTTTKNIIKQRKV